MKIKIKDKALKAQIEMYFDEIVGETDFMLLGLSCRSGQGHDLSEKQLAELRGWIVSNTELETISLIGWCLVHQENPDMSPKPDFEAAEFWLTYAAERGDGQAAYELAVMNYFGKGVEKREGRAILLLKTAIYGGMGVDAVFLLGAVFAEMGFSAQGWGLLRLAKDYGDEKADEEIRLLMPSLIDEFHPNKEIYPLYIEQAQNCYDEWKEELDRHKD